MDIFGTILTHVVAGAANLVGQSLYKHLKQVFHDYFKNSTENTIYQALEEIGNLSDTDIRKRVDELARQRKLTPAQADELTNLLINLSRGIHFHSTHGTPRSSFLRCERLLDQLLDSILPKRRKGEIVAENGMPDWKLTRFLGMGSFGEVWEAQNPHYPELRAIKFFTNPDAEQWITAEQRTLYQVRDKLPKHSNLISFLNVAVTGKPHPYLELEYVNGGSLEDWILRNEQERQPLDKRLVVEGVVRGLSEAHQNGIAHCDLKPANILLAVADGSVVPKIADFGLGRAQVGRSDASAQASQAGVGGTTMYLPPESLQPFVQRSPFKDDIFAVGVVWYQVLVGRLERPPYDFANHLRDNLVDSQTIRVIERCLAQPDRRFKDASELEQSLDSLPQVPDWTPPPDCFDVQHLAREYLTSQA